MVVLATPKKNSYIVKRDFTSKIVESRTSKNYEKSMKERVNAFKSYNLKEVDESCDGSDRTVK